MSSSPFLPVIVALTVVFLLLTVARGKPNRGNGFRAADYGAKPLLSAWEIAILDELRQDMPAGFYACPQVRLKDMLNVDVGPVSVPGFSQPGRSKVGRLCHHR